MYMLHCMRTPGVDLGVNSLAMSVPLLVSSSLSNKMHAVQVPAPPHESSARSAGLPGGMGLLGRAQMLVAAARTKVALMGQLLQAGRCGGWPEPRPPTPPRDAEGALSGGHCGLAQLRRGSVQRWVEKRSGWQAGPLRHLH